MTQQEFIDAYCARSGVTWDWLSTHRSVVPCDCGELGCDGWAMVPKGLTWFLDEAYSVIGGVMTSADNVPDDKRGAALEKAQELLRLANELDVLLRGGGK